jgi:ubiquinone/menaquinone biosynthesis C-methylase UbiE
MGALFPYVYDLLMKPLEITRFRGIREKLISHAEGRVLEIGSGTGVNFPLYKCATQVDAIEPNTYMRNKSLERMKLTKIPIQTYLVKAESLPFPDNTFDTVVGTLVFCTIPDPLKALNEVRRVCKPNGKLLLFEHVRVEQPILAKTQDKLTPYWKKLCDGCHLNRNTLDLVEKADFTIQKVNPVYKGLFLSIECSNSK